MIVVAEMLSNSMGEIPDGNHETHKYIDDIDVNDCRCSTRCVHSTSSMSLKLSHLDEIHLFRKVFQIMQLFNMIPF